MTRDRDRTRLAPWMLALGAFGVLAACQEPEVVLPGKREPIASVLSSTPDTALPLAEAVANETRPIALPAQQANAQAAQFEGTPAFRTAHPALAGGVTRIWSANIGAGDGRKQRITADPVVGGGRVFAMDAEAQVTAVSPAGEVLWSTPVRGSEDASDATGGGLAYDDGTIYAASGYGVVAALDAATGAVRWEQELDATAPGRPMVFGGLVYVVAGDETGWAIEADTGRIAWQVSAASSVSNVLGAPSPVLSDGFVIFAFGSGEIQAVFRQGGLRRWDSSVLGERRGRALSKIDDVAGTPYVTDGIVYAGSQAGRTVAIDAGSGARIWTAREGAIDPVLPVGGSVFLVSDRNELLRLDASDGSRIWGVRLPNFTSNRPRRSAEVYAHHGPILAGGRIVLASGDGLLRFFNPESGALVATAEIPNGATTRPIVAGNTLYVVGRNGQLHAFR